MWRHDLGNKARHGRRKCRETRQYLRGDLPQRCRNREKLEWDYFVVGAQATDILSFYSNNNLLVPILGYILSRRICVPIYL